MTKCPKCDRIVHASTSAPEEWGDSTIRKATCTVCGHRWYERKGPYSPQWKPIPSPHRLNNNRKQDKIVA